MSNIGKVIGTISVVGGVAGTLVFGGVAARKRALRLQREAAIGERPDYDMLVPDRAYSINADDGIALRVEEVGPRDAPLTVIFSHGWCLRMGAWHYQRVGLSGPGFGSGKGLQARLVFYDQRSHGRSGRSSAEHCTIDDLGRDLRAVLETSAPHGPVVLIGHSMGGMSIFGFASQYPEMFAERVAGIGLLSTTVGRAPAAVGALSKVLRSAVVRWPSVLERSRSGVKDAIWELTRVFGFARRDVSPMLVDYADEMISGTPLDAIVDFIPAILGTDKSEALPVLSRVPGVIICGDRDKITPISRSRAMADNLSESEFVVVDGAGHMVLMEFPDLVTDALRGVLWRAAERAGVTRRRGSAGPGRASA